MVPDAGLRRENQVLMARHPWTTRGLLPHDRCRAAVKADPSLRLHYHFSLAPRIPPKPGSFWPDPWVR